MRIQLIHLLRRLVRDETGMVLSVELVLLATLTLIGLIVGLSAYRDSLAQELGDTAASLANLQQSYSIDEVSLSGSFGTIPYDVTINASSYSDATDRCEQITDAAGQAPMCMQIINATIRDEGVGVLTPTP